MTRIALFITSLFFLSACGQKGDLYLPQTEATPPQIVQ